MLINDIITQLIQIAEIDGNKHVNISIGTEADSITTHIEPPYDKIEIKGWIGHEGECLYSKPVIVQKELEL